MVARDVDSGGYIPVVTTDTSEPGPFRTHGTVRVITSTSALLFCAWAFIGIWRHKHDERWLESSSGVIDGREVKAELASATYSCAKYGCIDVRTTNECQCSTHCVKEGGCCPDFKETCSHVTPANNTLLGKWHGCAVGSDAPLPALPAFAPSAKSLRVRVLSYNMEWWHLIEQLGGHANSGARLIAEAAKAQPFDFIGLQEFYDPWYGLRRPGYDASALLSNYQWIRGEVGGPVGSLIGFRNASWELLVRGQQYVAEDKKGPGTQYYGKRIAFWARLRHKDTGHTVLFVNHHGPLPVNTGGWCGHRETTHNLLQVMVQRAKPGDAIIVTGDFNSNTGSETISILSTKLTRAYFGAVYSGIDNIFTNLPPPSVLCTGNLGPGGSDHDAINVVLELPAKAEDPSGSTQQPPAQCGFLDGASELPPRIEPADRSGREATMSCAKKAGYGCVDYDPSHACQCNAECDDHHSCCPDFQDECQTSSHAD